MSRKKWLLVKLILLVLMFFTLGGIAIKMMGAPKFDENKFRNKFENKLQTKFGLSMENGMPIEEGEKKSFPDVEKIVIGAVSLPVDIHESDVTEVTIQDNSTTSKFATKKQNKISYENGVLSFQQAKQKPFLSFVRGNVVVEVPRGSVLEYDIESISGGIIHDAMSKGALKAESVSGSIKIYQGGETAAVETISGSVQISGPFKELRAESVSGSIKQLANQDSKEISGSSISGSVRIQLEKVPGYQMNYSTVSGSVKDTYSNISYSKSGKATNGDGSLQIRAGSVSGSIKLTDWE